MHAEKLSDTVLQSVVDLLWNQLNSMSLSVMSSGASVQENDLVVTADSDESVIRQTVETRAQCK